MIEVNPTKESHVGVYQIKLEIELIEYPGINYQVQVDIEVLACMIEDAVENAYLDPYKSFKIAVDTKEE